MKKTIFAALAVLGLAIAPIATAQASSHTGAARAETKQMLLSAVEEVCTARVVECQMLRVAARDLYSDPLAVTKADLQRVDTLKFAFAKLDAPAIKARLANASLDLAAAIDRVEILTAHVFYLHEGKWEQLALCEMPTT